MSSRVWLAVFLLALFAAGCTDAPDAGATPTDTTTVTDEPTPTGTPDEAIDPDSTTTVEALEWTPPTSSSPGSALMAMGNQPFGIEYNIWQHGYIVARVRLLEVEERIQPFSRKQYEAGHWLHRLDVTGDTVYVANMAFGFEVLEYLKGGEGKPKIWGVASMEYGAQNTKEEACAVYSYHAKRRDKRWDDREAIITFMGVARDTLPDNHYFIGMLSVHYPASYSLSGNGAWYPVATESSGSAASSREKQFLMMDPDVPLEVAKSSGVASRTPTKTLAEIRHLASLSDAELEVRHFEKGRKSNSELLTARNLIAVEKDGAVTLQWEGTGASSKATAYRVLRRSEDDSEFAIVGDVAVPPAKDYYEYKDSSGFAAGVKYTYIVRAITDREHHGVDAQISLVTSGVKATATPTP